MTMHERNISKKLKEFLGTLLVPEEFGSEQKQALLMRLSYIIQAFPTAYWTQFEQLHRLVAVIQSNTIPSCEIDTEIIRYLKKNKWLTSYPFAAAIGAVAPQNATPQWLSKFNGYQAIVLVVCFMRRTCDPRDSVSGNENALRELRLVAMNPMHRKLLDVLPDLGETPSIHLLVSKLKELRKEKHPALVDYGLGYFELVIRDALSWTKRRRRKIRIPPPSDTDTIVEVDPIDIFDDAKIKVEELCIFPHKPTTSQERDECLSVKSGRTIRIQECAETPNSKANRSPSSRAVRAIQHQCLTEKLSIMQLSLGCSYNQLTDWDVRQLIRYTSDGIKNGSQPDTCSTLLLSLLCGRDPISLKNPTTTFRLEHYKNHPCLYLGHSVPASTQDDRLEKCFRKTNDHLILPLPKILQGRLTPDNDKESLDSMLQSINEHHRCRLSLGRIARFMEHWYINNGLDRAEVGLIKGRSPRNQPALSYTNFDADKLIENYRAYVLAIFSMAQSDPQLPTAKPTNKKLGSALHLPSNTLHNFFRILRCQIPRPLKHSLEDLASLHNHYVCYVWALLTFSTGHRDVNAPMGQRTDFNSYNNSWWISDKENRHGLAARTLILPATAIKQLEQYLNHLQELKKHSQLIAEDIFSRTHAAITGKDNLLFFIKHHEQNTVPTITQELTPARVKAFLGDKLPWPANWGRHHLRSELKRIGVAPAEIDCWMGHEEVGEESMGRHSALSIQYLKRIAQQIEVVLNTHQITVVDAWKTR
ncbi:hypothetical protein VXM60_15240 [Shewanella khirikhana]|uniref:hypothetical protein n=1 Tax=Shewanella khirikhana TaxID=1965282 RepID=UPI0030CF7817